MAVRLLCFATENAEEVSRSERELRALAERAFSLARTASLPYDKETIRDAVMSEWKSVMFPDRGYLDYALRAEPFAGRTHMPGLSSTNETGEMPFARSYKKARHASSLHDSLGKEPGGVGSLGELPLSRMSIDNLLRLIPQIDPIVTLNSACLPGAFGGPLPTTCGQPALANNHPPATRHASHKRVQGLGAVNLNTGLRCAMRGMVVGPDTVLGVGTERPMQAGIFSGAVGSSLHGRSACHLRSYGAYCKQQEDGRRSYRWDQHQSQRGREPKQLGQQKRQWGYGSKQPQHQQSCEQRVLQEWKRPTEWVNQNAPSTSLLKADGGHPGTDGRYSRKRYRQRETAPYFTTYTGHHRAKPSMVPAAYEQAGQHRPWGDLEQQQVKQQQSEFSQQTLRTSAIVIPQVQPPEDRSREVPHLEKGVLGPRTAEVAQPTLLDPPRTAKRASRWSPPRASASFERGGEQAHGGNGVKTEVPAAEGDPELRPDAGGPGDGSDFAAAPMTSAGQQATSAATVASGRETQKMEQEQQQETCTWKHPPPPPLQPQQMEQPRAEAEASDALEAAVASDGRDQEPLVAEVLHALGCGASAEASPTQTQAQAQSCSGGPAAEAPQPAPAQAQSCSSQDVEPRKKRKRRAGNFSKQKSRRKNVCTNELAAGEAASADAAAEAAAGQEAAEAVANSQKTARRQSSKRKSKQTDASPPQASLCAPLEHKSERQTRQDPPRPKEYTRFTRRRLAETEDTARGKLARVIERKPKASRIGKSRISSRRSAPLTVTKPAAAAAVKVTSALAMSKAPSAVTDKEQATVASKSGKKVRDAGAMNAGKAARPAGGADSSPATGLRFKARVSELRANVGAMAHMSTDASDLLAQAGLEAAPAVTETPSPQPRRGKAKARTRAKGRMTRSSASCTAAEATDTAGAEKVPVIKAHSPLPSDKLRAAERASDLVGDGDGDGALPSHPEPTGSWIPSKDAVHNQPPNDGISAEGLARTGPCLSASGTLQAEASPFASATGATEPGEDPHLQDELSNGPQKCGAEAQNHANAVSTSGVRMAAPGRPAPAAAATVTGAAESKPERRYKPVAPARRPPHARAGSLPSTHADLAAVAAAILASQQATGRMADTPNVTPADDLIIVSDTSADADVTMEADVAKAAAGATTDAAKESDAAAPPAVPPPSAHQPADPAVEQTSVQDPAFLSTGNRARGSGMAEAAQTTTTAVAYDDPFPLPADNQALNLSNWGTDGVPAASFPCDTVTGSAATASGASRRDAATAAAAAVAAAEVPADEREHDKPAGASDVDACVPLQRPLSDTATSPVRQPVTDVDLGGETAFRAGAAAETAAPAEQPEIEAEAGVQGEMEPCSDADGQLSRRNSDDCGSGAEGTLDGDGEGSGNEDVRSQSPGDGQPENSAAAAAAADLDTAGGSSGGASGEEVGHEQDEGGDPEVSEVEQEEWRRRRAEIERQRAEAAAEREAARRARAARAASSATEELERRIRQRLADHHQLASAAAAEAAAKEDIRARVRANLQERFRKALEESNLSRMLKQLDLLPKGQYLRSAEQRSKALKIAKIRFHPDKVTGSLEDRVYAEEVSKLLNSWNWNK